MPIGLGLGLRLGHGIGGGALADYYVDSVNGSDSNDGTSPDTAFASISEVTSVLAEGDVVALARGSYWRETINAPTIDNVTIMAYGEGQLPSLDCADVAENASFSATPETTNVYQIEWVVETGGDGHLIGIWEDTVRLRWATSVANCDSTPGTFYVTSVGTTYTVYVHPFGSTNPTSDGKLYEIPRRNSGIRTGENWLVENIRTRRNLNNNGSLILETGSRAVGCIAEDGVKHNAFGSINSVFENCIAYKCAYPEREDATLFVAFVLDGSGGTAQFINCIALLDQSTRDYGVNGVGSVTGFYAHTDGTPGNEFDHVSFTGCLSAWCNTGIAGADTLILAETRNRIHRNFTSVQFLATGQTYQSTDCWLDIGSGGSGVRGLSLDCAEVDIVGMRGYVNRASIDAFFYITDDTTISIDQSTLVLIPTSGYQYGLRATSSGSNTSMTNNLIIGNQDTGEVAVVAYHNPTTVDENVYGGSASCDAELDGSGYSTIGAYLTAAQGGGAELNSVQSAVTLTDPANGDFSVSSGPSVSFDYGVQNAPTYLDVPTYEDIDLL